MAWKSLTLWQGAIAPHADERSHPMSADASWKPIETHADLTTEKRDDLPTSAYAFPKQRKEPLTDAAHVRNAVARFNQVEGVSDSDREQAFANIQKAARHFHVDVQESSWQELMA
jgi:hypothetical protein